MNEQSQSGASPTATRLAHIDMVRGLVMVFMAIDHVRDFIAPVGDPVDLATASSGLFLLRWLAHFCAPVFAFLMGTSVWLSAENKPGTAVSRQLIVRGLLLVALEFTLVDWAWNFYPPWPRKFFQVIAALGISLILLAGLIRLGHRAVFFLGIAMIALHNLADGIRFAPDTLAHVLWSILHQRNVLPLGGGWEMRISYPIAPIAAVAFLGYGLAPWVARRDRRLIPLGLGALAAFLFLRVVVNYGDPNPFSTTISPLMSLVNVTKYPLSLQFVLMTIGPALIVLALWRHPREPFLTLGRVPLFYYVAHIATIHALLLTLAWLSGVPPDPGRFGFLPAGFTLPVWSFVPLALTVVAALYPACRAYAGLRASGRYKWLKYL